MMPARPPLSPLLLVLACCAASLAAQCQPVPFPTGPRAGANGPVHAFGRWDPDGPGPQPERQLLAGAFWEVGAVRTSVAVYDEATGLQPFADCNGAVHCFATDGNGDLLVGGSFTSIGGVATGPLARFDGSTWSSLGATLTVPTLGPAAIYSIVARANGDLVVGGHFGTIGGVPAWSIAERSNGAWQSLGDVEIFYQPGTVARVLIDGNGDLLAAGTFASIGGLVTSGIARWDGSSWSPLGAAATGFTVLYDAMLHPTGDVYVVGPFATIGGVSASWAARWDGTGWNALPGLPSIARGATLLANGDLAVTGQFSLPNASPTPIAIWDGASWSGFGTAELEHAATEVAQLPSGDFLLGGRFRWLTPDSTSPRVGTGNLSRSWQGSWGPLVSGTDGIVRDVAAGPGGQHYVAGSFVTFGGHPASGLGRIDTQFGLFSASQPTVVRDFRRLVRRGDGTLFVTARIAGDDRIFREQGGVTTQVGSADPGYGDAVLAIDQNGELLAGAAEVTSSFPAPTPLARRSNATGAWWPVDPLLTGRVTALCVLANGDLVVGGENLASAGTALGNLAVFHGSGWDALQGGVDAPPQDLEPRRAGGFVAVGPFQFAGGVPANGIAAWDGQGWQTFGSGFPSGDARTVVELPTGELLVGGSFQSAGGVPASHLARWDGAWHDAGVGIDGPVRRLDVAPDGEVAVCGDFLNVPQWPTAGVTVLTPTCPTRSDQQTFACGSSLPLQVEVRADAWRGAAIELEVAPFLGTSLAVGVFGTQTALLPLAQAGLPGSCYLELQPDVLMLATPQQAVAPFSPDVPDLAAAVGVTIYHQTIGLDFSALGALSVRTSPRMGLLVGSLW
ncbi:MAG: hypothetical protein ACE37K_23600 [Planctomycetota bacterium]